jgi:hypothetical protein
MVTQHDIDDVVWDEARTMLGAKFTTAQVIRIAEVVS